MTAALVFAGLATINLMLIGWQAIHGNVAGAAILVPIYGLPPACLCIAAIWVPRHFSKANRPKTAFVAATALFAVAIPAAFLEMFVVSG
jgi:hypothetical protein